MEPLTILLIILAAVAVWAVAELALTLRKARTTLDEVSHSATEAIDQATPVITKLDGVVDELQPALREVSPVMDKVSVLMDEATISLDGVNNIIGDVSSATHGVAGVGESASRIVNTATSAAVGVVSKVASLGGITIPEGQNLISKGKGAAEGGEETAALGEAPAPEEAQAPANKGYVTYNYVSYAPAEEEAEEDNKADESASEE